jgi:hypothetical protein
MCKFMHLAHIANKTRVDHDNILGIITSMIKSECHDKERMFFPLKDRNGEPERGE